MSKPKFFVSYPPGGSGHFLCLLLLSLQHSATLSQQHSVHDQINIINAGHNFAAQWTDSFRRFTDPGADLALAVPWLQKTFEFGFTDQNFYVVHTHALSIDALAHAWPDAKFVYVTCGESDLDQLAFNWVTKSAMLYQQWDIVQRHLGTVQTSLGRLANITADDLVHSRNIKLMAYIVKFATRQRHLQRVNIHSDHQCFNLAFADIGDPELIDQLPALAEFLGLDVTVEHLQQATSLIKQYAGAQVPVPWTLSLDDYT